MKCKVCEKEFQQITSSHLKTHGLTVDEYKNSFPQAQIFSSKTRLFLSEKCKEQNNSSTFGFKDNHKVNEGKNPWNKNKTKNDDPRIKGDNRLKSKETKYKMSLIMKEKYKLGLIDVSGPKNGMYGKKLSEQHKLALWSGWRRRMNKPETKCYKALIQYGFSYTGDGKLWLKFKDGRRKNPDFISKKHNCVVEVFGNYWHSPDEVPYIQEMYKDLGYKCMIIWENEVDNFFCEAIERFLGIWEFEDFKYEDFNGGWIL